MEYPYMKDIAKLDQLIKDGDPEAVSEFLKVTAMTPDEYIDGAQYCFSIELACVCLTAKLGNVDMLNVLLKRGFCPEERWYFNLKPVRPIHMACRFGHHGVVKLLVEEYNVNVDSEHFQEAPLKIAVLNKHETLINYLLDKGASVNISMDPQNNSLLHYAVDQGQITLVKKLISKGADVNAKNDRKMTPLLVAARAGDLVGVEALTDDGADVNAVDDCENSAVLYAVICREQRGNLALVKFLTSRGADPEVADHHGNTPLHVSAFNGLFNITRHLVVDVNVSMETEDAGDRTAFGIALWDGRFPQITHLLLDSGYMADEVRNMNPNKHYMISQIKRVDGLYCVVMQGVKLLQELASFALRRALGRKLPVAVKKLSLPKVLRDLVMLTKIEEEDDDDSEDF